MTAPCLNMFDDSSTNFIERFFEIVSLAVTSFCGHRLIDGIRHDWNNEKRERNRNELETDWKRTRNELETDCHAGLTVTVNGRRRTSLFGLPCFPVDAPKCSITMRDVRRRRWYVLPCTGWRWRPKNSQRRRQRKACREPQFVIEFSGSKGRPFIQDYTQAWADK